MAGTSITQTWNPITQQYESVESVDGSVKVTGADGAPTASEATAQSIDDDTTALAGTVRGSPGTTNDQGVGAHILSAPILTTQPAPSFQATVPSADGTETPPGTYVYLAGVGRVDVGGEVPLWALPVSAYKGGDWSVNQGAGDPGRVWYVRGTNDLDEPERLATEATVDVIAKIGLISEINSTTTPLGANEEFIGGWVDALQYVDIRVAIKADVASADEGLVIEQSHDGITVIADDSYMVTSNRKGTFAAQRAARYVRVRYLNGTTPQASFAMQTILSRAAPIQSVHNIGHVDNIHGEDDAQLTIAVIAGSAPGTGTWRAARVDQYRRLMVATAQESSPLHTVATGRVDVNATAETLIVSPAYTEQTVGAQRSIVSTSAQDGVGGTGIRSVVIEYYRDDMEGPFFETVVLNGLTPVDTVATDICYIEKLYGITGGSALAVAAGDIALKASTAGAGATIWSIPVGDRKARGAHHYLSPGADVHVTSTVAGVTGTGAASLYLLFGPILETNYCYQQVSPTMRVSDNGQAQLTYPSPLNIAGPGRLVMAVKRDSAPAVMTYAGAFSFYHNTDM